MRSVWAPAGIAHRRARQATKRVKIRKPCIISVFPVRNPDCTQAAMGRPRNKAMSMPTVFLSHGSPMLILEDRPARAFLAPLGQRLPRPRPIVAAPPRGDPDVPAVSPAHKPATIHDFYGFPEA